MGLVAIRPSCDVILPLLVCGKAPTQRDVHTLSSAAIHAAPNLNAEHSGVSLYVSSSDPEGATSNVVLDLMTKSDDGHTPPLRARLPPDEVTGDPNRRREQRARNDLIVVVKDRDLVDEADGNVYRAKTRCRPCGLRILSVRLRDRTR